MKLAQDKICSFCGAPWSEDNLFAGGYGAMVCLECIDRYHGLMHDPVEWAKRRRPVWDEMSVDELLETLPNIVRTCSQVDQFLHDWVQMLHDRGASWQKIGMTLGVSRQAAWERFHRGKSDLTQDEISG